MLGSVESVDRREFRELLGEAQRLGRLTPKIVQFMRQYVFSKLDMAHCDKEEIFSAVLRRFSQKWETLDIGSNPLAFLGAMLWWERQSLFRKQKRRREIISYECEIGQRNGREFSIEEC